MYGLFFSSAMAQDTAAAAAQPNPIMSMLPLVLVFIIFYFLMIRPQQKKAQKDREYISSIEKGVEVYTKAGIIGTITSLTDKVVTLEIEGGGKIKLLRSHIGGALSDVVGTKQAASTK
jgi:preprotein translocase subunit YajC